MAAGLYDITHETLGKGHFAIVKLARHCLTGELVAVKIIDKSKLNHEGLLQLGLEISLLSRLSENEHQNIVKLYQVIDTKTKLYLVMEYCGRDVCDLYDYILRRNSGNGLKESEAKHIFRQICSAISYCHSLRIVHRDLKPENILIVTQPQDQQLSPSKKYPIVKLIDFGFSNQWHEGEKLRTSCGSLAYSAPEILLGDHYDGDKVDIWGLGCILYILLYGNNPFMQINDSETLIRILDCTFTTPPRPSISESAITLIKALLKKDPTTRLTVEEILAHNWLLSSETEEIEIKLETVPEAVKCNISKQKMKTNVHDRVIDQMIAQGMCSSRDHVECALKKARDNCTKHANTLTTTESPVNINGELNGETGHKCLSNENYITATYHLLKDKLLRELQGIQGISDVNSSQLNFGRHHKRVLPQRPRKQLLQQPMRLRPGKSVKATEEPSFCESSSSPPSFEITAEEDETFVLPLARKCSIVSEEGSCAGTDFSGHDCSSERLLGSGLSDVGGSRASVDIIVTDCSEEDNVDSNEDLQDIDIDKMIEESQNETKEIQSNSPNLGASSSTAMHLVSSSPELLRDHEDFNGNGCHRDRYTQNIYPELHQLPHRSATMVINNRQEARDDIGDHVVNHFNQPTGQNSKPLSSLTSTSMRVIIQSKSCNNILFNDEDSKKKSEDKTDAGNNQLMKRSKNDKTDCCTIC